MGKDAARFVGHTTGTMGGEDARQPPTAQNAEHLGHPSRRKTPSW